MLYCVLRRLGLILPRMWLTACLCIALLAEPLGLNLRSQLCTSHLWSCKPGLAAHAPSLPTLLRLRA